MICDIKGRNIDIHTVQRDSNSLGLFSFHFFRKSVGLTIEPLDHRYAPEKRGHYFIHVGRSVCSPSDLLTPLLER